MSKIYRKTKKTVISYHWSCEQIKGNLPSRLKEALEESAEDRIKDMMNEGYVEGELNTYVNMELPGLVTPEDGWYCTGWWKGK